MEPVVRVRLEEGVDLGLRRFADAAQLFGLKKVGRDLEALGREHLLQINAAEDDGFAAGGGENARSEPPSFRRTKGAAASL